MENLYAQTNVPPRAEPQKLETTERFNGYYNQEIAIDVQKYDFALAFFKEKTGDDAVAHNLTDTLFEVSLSILFRILINLKDFLYSMSYCQ